MSRKQYCILLFLFLPFQVWSATPPTTPTAFQRKKALLQESISRIRRDREVRTCSEVQYRDSMTHILYLKEKRSIKTLVYNPAEPNAQFHAMESKKKLSTLKHESIKKRSTGAAQDKLRDIFVCGIQ